MYSVDRGLTSGGMNGDLTMKLGFESDWVNMIKSIDFYLT